MSHIARHQYTRPARIGHSTLGRCLSQGQPGCSLVSAASQRESLKGDWLHNGAAMLTGRVAYPNRAVCREKNVVWGPGRGEGRKKGGKYLSCENQSMGPLNDHCTRTKGWSFRRILKETKNLAQVIDACMNCSTMRKWNDLMINDQTMCSWVNLRPSQTQSTISMNPQNWQIPKSVFLLYSQFWHSNWTSFLQFMNQFSIFYSNTICSSFLSIYNTATCTWANMRPIRWLHICIFLCEITGTYS